MIDNPDIEMVLRLLKPLRNVFVADSEEYFDLVTAVSCMHGWVYPWLAAMTAWVEDQGFNQYSSNALTHSSNAGALA